MSQTNSICSPLSGENSPAKSLAVPPGRGELAKGGTLYVKRHQRMRFASYIRSSFLILCSLIASTASTATQIQTNQVMEWISASTGATACVVLDATTLLELIVVSSLLTTGLIACLLLTWQAFILPRVDLYTERWAAKQRAKAKEGI